MALAALAASASARGADPQIDDPMRPYVPATPTAAAQSTARPFKVTGVLIGATRRVAVINGTLCREGDTVDGARVVSIEPGSVQLRRSNETLVVQLERRTARTRTNHGEPAQ